MNDFTKKAVAYVRISSVRQIDNESPDTQRQIILRYADTNNIEIIEWFYDEAKSGKNTEREELKNLLNFAGKYKGKIDHVIVYKMNRMSRDLDSYVMNVKMVLKAMGVTIRSATEQIDDTITGRMMENLLIILGQMDNEVKAGATIDNMKALAMQGYYQHPPIVGYEPAKIDNGLGKPRPSLKKSPMADRVTSVLERFSVGDITKAELTRYAKQVGLKSRYGKFLGEDSIHRLIKNPTYAGYVNDKFTDYKNVEGKHPTLISKVTYEKNQRFLYGKDSRKGERHDHINSDYPLRGLLLCSNCKKTLYSSAPRTGNGQTSPRYHCARKSCVGKVPSVKADVVHEEFIQVLKKIKPSDEILKVFKQVLVKESNSALSNLNSKIAKYRNDLNKISVLRSKAIDRFVAEELTKEEKDTYIVSLDNQKLEASSELAKLEQQQMIREVDIEQAINVMENVDKQWAVSEIDLQIRFQSMLFPRGLEYDSKNHKFGTWKISELYRCASIQKGSEEPSNYHLVAGRGLEPLTSWL
jgi:site-specific DNA recombinase